MKFRKLRWYFHRLLSLSPQELIYRLEKQILNEYQYILFSLKKGKLSSDRSQLLNKHEFNKSISCLKESVNNSSPYQSHFDNSISSADMAEKNSFHLFGQRIDFGKNINWHMDPMTHEEWPRKFWSKIDIRDGSTVGGIKWVWELNRHHHLLTLAKAYLLTSEVRCAEKVVADIIDWIENNPRYLGVNWTSPLEISIRLINWIWALTFIIESELLDENSRLIIFSSIYEQADHISHNLSKYSSANNHLIGEAAGIGIVGMCFPWMPNSEMWRRLSFQILERELGKQIYPDGVPAEQTIHYLAFILDFNLLVWLIAEKNGYKVPDIWYDRLSAACEFLCNIMDENGNVPDIGDRDDGWVVRLDDRKEANNYRSILATASVILEKSVFKNAATEWDDKSHWLLGEIGRQEYEELPRTSKEPRSEKYPYGGYCVMRAKNCVILFDCGPLGYLSTAAHGHADALSIMVSISGTPVLIDPGTYAYQEGGLFRDYFRSTFAHNTIAVDNANQSEMAGTFLWRKKARTNLLHWESNLEYDLAIAEHNGYSKFGVLHKRTVFFNKPDMLLVIDNLVGNGMHTYHLSWHFPEQCVIKTENSCSTIVINEIELTVLNLEGGNHPVIYKGQNDPIQGWISPSYGMVREAPVIAREEHTQLPVKLVTGIYFGSMHSGGEINSLNGKMEMILESLVQKGLV